jgi:hypothetical protein
MTIYYAIKYGDQYIVGTEPNEKYCSSKTAPTMGARYDHSEYKTVLSDEPNYFERLTAVGNIRVLMEEFRWGDKKPQKIELIPGV